MISVKNLYKSFGDTEVLRDITQTFERGKTNLVIGASGSGKSTLAKCIVGLHEPTSGSVYFDEHEYTALSLNEKKEIRKEIGFLFQGSALFDYLTVEENIMFPLRMFSGFSEEEMLDRANFCLKRVDLEGKNHLFPSELSGGMMKRVAIARAISMKPKYLFCDEPNSGLDPQTSILIDNLIKEITVEYNMTTVVITHDMNSVIEIGERISFLHKGDLWWSGSSEEILRTENQEVIDFVYASKYMAKLRKA